MPLPYVTEKQAKETKDKIKELNERIDVIESGGGSGSGIYTVAVNMNELSEEATEIEPGILPTSMADPEKFWELLKLDISAGTCNATDLMTGYLTYTKGEGEHSVTLMLYLLESNMYFEGIIHLVDANMYGSESKLCLALVSHRRVFGIQKDFNLSYVINNDENPELNHKFIYWFEEGH